MNLSQSHQLSKYTDDRLAKSITAKLEDGDVRAALRLLLCDDKPAEINDDTYAKLLERHPRATSSRPIAPLSTDDTPCFQVSESEVLKAAPSFPVGSSGGPDGIRPLHVTALFNCKEAGAKLLTAITAFTNMLLKGNCPADVVPILFGGNLTALIKKSGGIRPIAVGYYWRRLSAKCANASASKKLYDFFSPIQLGVGVSGGCEAAIHVCRRYVASLPEGHVVVNWTFQTHSTACIVTSCLKQYMMLSRKYTRFVTCHILLLAVYNSAIVTLTRKKVFNRVIHWVPCYSVLLYNPFFAH
jgi:hypothetical protein